MAGNLRLVPRDEEQKSCTSCGVEKPLSEFRTSKHGKAGKSSQCIDCLRADDRSRRAARYRTDAVFTCNRAIIKRQSYGTSVCLVDEATAYRAVSYMLDELGMVRTEYAKQYASALNAIRTGREARMQERQALIDQERELRAMAAAQKAIDKARREAERKAAGESFNFTREDIGFMLFQRVRYHMKKQRRYRNGCVLTMRSRGSSRDQAMLEALGYTPHQLMIHIEAQFIEGMTWGKVASGAVHIDHIVPASDFNLMDVKEVRACYSLGNLRPMWADENVEKGADRVYLL